MFEMQNYKRSVTAEEETKVLSRLQAYIQLEGGVNDLDVFGETLLLRSLEKGYYRVASYLIREGADLDVRDCFGRHISTLVFQTRNIPLMEQYIKTGHLDSLTIIDLTDAIKALILNMEYSDSEYFGLIFKEEVTRNLKRVDISTMVICDDLFVFYAVDILSIELVNLYLRLGGSLFVRNRWGMSPFTFLMQRERECEMVEDKRTLLKVRDIRSLMMSKTMSKTS